MEPAFIRIRGAREHNLKNVSLDIPRDRLVVITGISGSGKSSLAFDTLYAEGQRRYVESLSAYARQFLEQMDKPDVDSIEGLSPAISIEQKAASKNPRSTVATVTEIYDHLRLLYAHAGTPHCHRCGREVRAMSAQQIADELLKSPAGTRLTLLAPIVSGQKGEHRKLLEQLARDGFARARIDGNLLPLSEAPPLEKTKRHTIEVAVDRLAVRPGIESRLVDSVELALKKGGGTLLVVDQEGGEERPYSEKYACAVCGVAMPELSPRIFSFNNPYGACPRCHGLGLEFFFDENLVVPDDRLSIGEGAIEPWAGSSGVFYSGFLENLARHFGFDLSTPWRELPEKARRIVLHGSGREKVRFSIRSESHHHQFQRSFEGVIPNLERRHRETKSDAIREELARYMSNTPCIECRGDRLKPEVLAVRIGGRSIIELTRMPVDRALDFAAGLELDPRALAVCGRVVREITARLGFLRDVGLGYLTLDRASASLSGGEAQRIRLATQIGSALVGVVYILDEPSIGLHQRDNRRLIATLKGLRDLGNTVVVVEHDEETMLAADHLIDMGPGAGVHGGRVVAEGPPDEVIRNPDSITGRYLSGRERVTGKTVRRPPRTGEAVVVRGASENNLAGIDAAFPRGLLTCVTGVSGSGKSSLVVDTLHPALLRLIHRSAVPVGRHRALEGTAGIQRVVAIDQSPIGRTPRSNPATYTGVFGPIRELFAKTPDARVRGYAPGRFSFNVRGGRCETCEGNGHIRIEMQFLPDVFVRCEACGGARYARETLEVRYRGRNIADVLDMTVEEAAAFFERVPAVRRKLETLLDVGLGYIRLGQAATTLSGGEAQRVKLSRELSKQAAGDAVYLLDEPTTGLHPDDIRRLLVVLERLVDKGNTVIVIEHNLDVIATADWVIDLGPEGGAEGGRIVAAGTPEQVAACPESHTGRYLAAKLVRSATVAGDG